MRRNFLAFSLFCLTLLTSAEARERLYKTTNWIQTDKVILQGLDKVSARIFTAEVYLNQKVHFGSLEVFIKSANRAPPEEQPESICFVEIFDNKPGQDRQQVFSGWMFASNPALSALEHPVYDIWIKEAVAPVTSETKESVTEMVEEKPKISVTEEEVEEQVSSDSDID